MKTPGFIPEKILVKSVPVFTHPSNLGNIQKVAVDNNLLQYLMPTAFKGCFVSIEVCGLGPR